MFLRKGSYAVAGLYSALSGSFRPYTILPELTYPAALPKLPYDVAAGVPPVISPRQLGLHYSKHHNAYVQKLNSIGAGLEGKTMEDIMKEAASSPDKKVLFNQAAQHFNHTFYWKVLCPHGASTKMSSALETAITQTFGSVDKFKEAFQTAATNNFGSGWTWLCYVPECKKLTIESTGNAQCPVTQGLIPLLTVDVWEHAYYVDFENRRPDYLQEYWKIVNWDVVSAQYERAVKG